MPTSTNRLGLSIASMTVKVETEKLVFPLESLVAEVGGALGLFLGMSFLSAVDLLQRAVLLCHAVKKM